MVGGTLGLVSAMTAFTMNPFMAGLMGTEYATIWQYGGMIGKYGMFGYPEFGLAVMTEVMFVWSLIGLAGAVLSIYCGIKLQQNWTRDVAFIGLEGGFLLLLTFSWLPSLLVLAGAALAYVEQDAFSGSKNKKRGNSHPL